MHLEPVRPGRRPHLRDQDAMPPESVPRGEAANLRLARLTQRLCQLQVALYAEGSRALLVVLQAQDAAGKDGTVRNVFGPLNSQGCVVTNFKRPTDLELSHDYLWRVHQAVPAKGTIGVFNRSHYEDVLVVRVHDLVPRKVWSRRYEQINEFERMLSKNGVTILKFFLHISREEQKQRLLARLKDPKKNWKFQPGDLKERELWQEYREAYQDAIAKCSTEWAPWYVVPADRKSSRNVLIAQVLVRTLEKMHPKFPRANPEVLRMAEEIK